MFDLQFPLSVSHILTPLYRTAKVCRIPHLDSHTTAPEQLDVGCHAVATAAVTEMDGSGFCLFNSVSLLQAPWFPRVAALEFKC